MRSRILSLVLLGLAACSGDVDSLDSTAQPDAGHIAIDRSTEWKEVFNAYPTPEDLHFGRKIEIADDNIYVTSVARTTVAWRLTRYARHDGRWSQAKVLRAEDVQGDLTSPGGLYANENEVWLGVPGAGMGGEIWQLSPDLEVVLQRLPSPVPNAEFGTSIVANSDWLFVGAAGQDGSRGAVHVFQRLGTSLIPAGVLNPPAGTGLPRLGHAIAQDDLHLYVGAPDVCPGQGICGPGPGAVYVYSLDESGAWQLETIWRGPEAGVAGFGHDLAARSNGQVVVAAPYSEACEPDTEGCLTNTGQAYMMSGDGPAPLRPETPHKSREYFGKAVDAYGPNVVVGASGDQSNSPTMQGGNAANTGVVFVMTDGEPYRRLRPLLWNNRDRIGEAVAVSNDVMVITALNKNAPERTDRSGVITIFELREVLPED